MLLLLQALRLRKLRRLDRENIARGGGGGGDGGGGTMAKNRASGPLHFESVV
ncbi:hypothetical protein Hanom_Chr04g00377231 [Helianthus anomalus]